MDNQKSKTAGWNWRNNYIHPCNPMGF